MAKKLIITALISIICGVSMAQHTIEFTQPDLLFHQGKELFYQRKYAASYRNFEEFLKYDEINRQRIDWGVVSRSISMPEMLKGASPIRYNYPASEARSRLGK